VINRHGRSSRYDAAVTIRMRPVLVLVAALSMPMWLTACANSSSEAGFGLPVLDSSDAAAAIDSGSMASGSHAGTLTVERNGCFTWHAGNEAEADSVWIVWPEGARQDGAVVVLSSGERVSGGDALEAVGAIVSLADLPDGATDSSYFASFGSFCHADQRGVLVMTEVSRG
jgi:hypothetical protein